MEKDPSPATSLLEKDRRYLWHPFTQSAIDDPPIPIARAEGIYLYGHNGKRYIDAISSWWVNLHGHSHPYIIDQIKDQLDQLQQVLFAGCTHSPAVFLAEKLLTLLPGMGKIFYSDNGSTAVEIAIKMALQYHVNGDPATKKKKAICFKGGYHGDTFGAMSASGKTPFNRPFWNHLFDAVSIDPPFPGRERESLSQLQALLAKEDAAFFIFEPLLLGAGGMRPYSKEGLDLLLKECRAHKVLTIADEVMTGFGRIGPLFACDMLAEKPDFFCLSKGLTGGYLPLGATACTEEIYRRFLGETLERAFLHGHSYTANPLATRCALASLDLLLSENCLKQRTLIASHHQAFCQKWRSHPRLIRCETLGTILILEYKAPERSYFSPLAPALRRFFLEKGILIRPLGNVLYLMPPYIIDKESLETLYEQIAFTLENPHVL